MPYKIVFQSEEKDYFGIDLGNDLERRLKRHKFTVDREILQRDGIDGFHITFKHSDSFGRRSDYVGEYLVQDRTLEISDYKGLMPKVKEEVDKFFDAIGIPRISREPPQKPWYQKLRSAYKPLKALTQQQV